MTAARTNKAVAFENKIEEKFYVSVHTIYIRMSSENKSKRVNFRLPKDLIDIADVTAKVEHKNRTQVVKEALNEHIQKTMDEDFKQKVIDLYLEDELEYEVLREVLGSEDAEAVKSSKEILNQSDEMAEELSEL